MTMYMVHILGLLRRKKEEKEERKEGRREEGKEDIFARFAFRAC